MKIKDDHPDEELATIQDELWEEFLDQHVTPANDEDTEAHFIDEDWEDTWDENWARRDLECLFHMIFHSWDDNFDFTGFYSWNIYMQILILRVLIAVILKWLYLIAL